MKTRAAVAFEAGRPLEIVDVDLEAGAEIATRPFQLVTGRQWLGTADTV